MITLPENPNIPWLKNTMRELGLNSDRVTDDMCFAEFFKAYPEYVAAAKRLVDRSEGAKALFAVRMFEAGVVDAEWTDAIIATDSATHVNTLILLTSKIKDRDVILASRYSELASQKTEAQLESILGSVK